MVFGDIFRFLGVSVAGKIVPAAAAFLFSRYMGADDFGVLSLFTSYLWIVATLMSLNIYAGVGRVIFDPQVEPKQLLGTAVVMIAAVFGILLLGAIPLGQQIAHWLQLPAEALMLMPVVVAGYICESFVVQVLIFQRRSGLLLAMTGLRALTTVVVSMSLILALPDSKYMGVVIAETVSSTGFILATGLALRKHVQFTFVQGYAIRLLSYSLPLIVYVISLTLLAQSDRIMIDRYYGKEATGLYSLAYNFSSLMLLFVTAGLNALQPSFFAAMNAGKIERVVENSRAIMALALAAAVSLVLLGEPIAQLLFSSAYSNSFDIIPIIAIGCLALASFQTWVRVLAFHNRTGLISLIAAIAVVANIALNYWTLGPFGYKAAAYTTLSAQFVMAILCLIMLWYLQLLRNVRPLVDVTVATLICGMALGLNAMVDDSELNIEIRAGATLVILTLLGSFAWPRLRRAALGRNVN